MARLPAFRAAPLDDLARQLRFTPPDALRRHADHAEALAAEIEPERLYPEDWIVFRITGYRPDIPSPRAIRGRELLADLSTLAEHLSHAAAIPTEEARIRDWIDAPALASRWNVSPKTLARYRRDGLVARRTLSPDGLSRLAFTPAAIASFESRRSHDIRRASGFSRFDEPTRARILRRAERYRLSLGCSLNQAALRLADRFDRSHEGVRRLLRAADARRIAQGEAPIFADPPPLTERDARLIDRALRRGIEPVELAARFRRTRASIHRASLQARARRLRALNIGHIPGEALALHDPDATLALQPVREGLGVPRPRTLSALLALARRRVVPVGVEERARAMAQHVLRARAASAIASLSPNAPDADAIDLAETSLRWAHALRASLAATQLHLMVETLEAAIDSPLDTLRPILLADSLTQAFAALASSLDAYDPWKPGRLAAAANLSLARLAARLHPAPEPDRRRAQPRLPPDTPCADWTIALSPWRAALDPDPRIERSLDSIDAAHQRVLCARLGLRDTLPRTLGQLASELGVTRMQAGVLERRAIRAALDAARRVPG